MGQVQSERIATPTTIPANDYTQTLTCDLDLQSLFDAVTVLMSDIASTGVSNMRNVTITADSNKLGTLDVTANWKAV